MKNCKKVLIGFLATVGFLSVTTGCGQDRQPSVSPSVGNDSSSVETPSTSVENSSPKEEVSVVESSPGEVSVVESSPEEVSPEVSESVVVNNYTVTTSKEGHGNISCSAASVEEGSGVEITVTPDENYEIESVKVNGVEKEVGADGKLTIAEVKEDLNVVAKFVGVQVTVNFNNNGEALTPITTRYAQAYGTLPDVVVEEGLEFKGWFTQEGGQGSRITADTVVSSTAEHTVYAYVTAKTYAVTLDLDGGSSDVSSLQVTYKQAIGELPIPTKDGYVFVEWTNEAGEKVTSETVYAASSNSTLKANYAQIDVSAVEALYSLETLPSETEKTLELSGVQVTYKGENIVSQYDVSLAASNELVTVDGVNVSAATGAFGESVITISLNGVEIGSTTVSVKDYKGAGYTEVSSLEQFKAMTGSGKYVLTGDIDVGGTFLCDADWNMYIAKLEADAVIDGHGHTVSNAYLLSGWNKGWIGRVNGTVRDIAFTNIKSADKYPYNTALFPIVEDGGTIENVFLKFEFISDGENNNDMAGAALVGLLGANSTIRNCVVYTTTKEGVTTNFSSTLVAKAMAWTSTIENSYAINKEGLPLYMAEAAEGVFEYNARSGDVKSYKSVHSFIEEQGRNAELNSGYLTLDSTGIKYNGKLVVETEPASSAYIAPTMTLAFADGASYVDFSVFKYGELTDDYTATYTSSDESVFTVDAEGVVTPVDGGTAILTIVVNDEINLTTSITVDKTIYISTADQWYTAMAASPSGTFKLANDIDLAGGFLIKNGDRNMATTFTGVLDGNGHTVSNAWLSGGWNAALFCYNTGTIQNIAFKNMYSTNNVYDTALIASINNGGTISNVYVDFVVCAASGQDDTGGTLVAYMDGGKIENCVVNLRKFDSSVETPSIYGSLCGKICSWASIISNSYAIVNDTGIADIAYLEAAEGIISWEKSANGANQFASYADFYSGATTSTFGDVWNITSDGISFGGAVVLTA